MDRKYPTFSIQMKKGLRELLETTGQELGFILPRGKVNIGRTIRHLLLIGLQEETNLKSKELFKLL